MGLIVKILLIIVVCVHTQPQEYPPCLLSRGYHMAAFRYSGSNPWLRICLCLSDQLNDFLLLLQLHLVLHAVPSHTPTMHPLREHAGRSVLSGLCKWSSILHMQLWLCMCNLWWKHVRSSAKNHDRDGVHDGLHLRARMPHVHLVWSDGNYLYIWLLSLLILSRGCSWVRWMPFRNQGLYCHNHWNTWTYWNKHSTRNYITYNLQGPRKSSKWIIWLFPHWIPSYMWPSLWPRLRS